MSPGVLLGPDGHVAAVMSMLEALSLLVSASDSTLLG